MSDKSVLNINLMHVWKILKLKDNCLLINYGVIHTRNKNLKKHMKMSYRNILMKQKSQNAMKTKKVLKKIPQIKT